MLPDTRLPRAFACLSLALLLGACTTADPKLPNAASIPLPEPSPRLANAADAKPQPKSSARSVDGLISKYSVAYAVPESLVRRRSVQRESRFNPAARNGPYRGLMQMLPATARGMGHDGSAKDLLDAETNLKYGRAISGRGSQGRRLQIRTRLCDFTHAAIISRPSARACWTC